MKDLFAEIIFVISMICIYTFFRKFIDVGVELENAVDLDLYMRDPKKSKDDAIVMYF